MALFEKNQAKTCCSTRYKLILMDLNMPIMDGYEATIQILRRARQNQSGDSLAVVAVTAFVNEENIKQCYYVGMKEVLHKPVNF